MKCTCEIEVLFKCDPDKNTTCRKRSCREFCNNTREPDYAQLNDEGIPIISSIVFLEGCVGGFVDTDRLYYRNQAITGGK